jgi:hypothetical protein
MSVDWVSQLIIINMLGLQTASRFRTYHLLTLDTVWASRSWSAFTMVCDYRKKIDLAHHCTHAVVFIVPCRLQISQYSRIIKHAWKKGVHPLYALQSHRCKKLCLCIILCMPKISRPVSVNVLCLTTIMIDVYPRHWVTCPFLPSSFTHRNSNFNILTWTKLTMMGSEAREMHRPLHTNCFDEE